MDNILQTRDAVNNAETTNRGLRMERCLGDTRSECSSEREASLEMEMRYSRNYRFDGGYWITVRIMRGKTTE